MSAGVPMGFLIVWVVVIAGAGALLAGWALGSAHALPLAAVSPEGAAVGLLVAIVAADAASVLRRRRRR